jgi:hypothetical protein
VHYFPGALCNFLVPCCRTATNKNGVNYYLHAYKKTKQNRHNHRPAAKTPSVEACAAGSGSGGRGVRGLIGKTIPLCGKHHEEIRSRILSCSLDRNARFCRCRIARRKSRQRPSLSEARMSKTPRAGRTRAKQRNSTCHTTLQAVWAVCALAYDQTT